MSLRDKNPQSANADSSFVKGAFFGGVAIHSVGANQSVRPGAHTGAPLRNGNNNNASPVTSTGEAAIKKSRLC